MGKGGIRDNRLAVPPRRPRRFCRRLCRGLRDLRFSWWRCWVVDPGCYVCWWVVLLVVIVVILLWTFMVASTRQQSDLGFGFLWAFALTFCHRLMMMFLKVYYEWYIYKRWKERGVQVEATVVERRHELAPPYVVDVEFSAGETRYRKTRFVVTTLDDVHVVKYLLHYEYPSHDAYILKVNLPYHVKECCSSFRTCRDNSPLVLWILVALLLGIIIVTVTGCQRCRGLALGSLFILTCGPVLVILTHLCSYLLDTPTSYMDDQLIKACRLLEPGVASSDTITTNNDDQEAQGHPPPHEAETLGGNPQEAELGALPGASTSANDDDDDDDDQGNDHQMGTTTDEVTGDLEEGSPGVEASRHMITTTNDDQEEQGHAQVSAT